jgi:serine/threonine protein kinase
MGWWQELDGPLLGRYRIERLLGEGGMARVFLATDLKSGREVAVKSPKIESFPPDRLAELLKRFSREFQSQIKDPIQGVVPVFDADEVSDAHGVSRPILVMQYLSGGSLATKLGGRVGARTHRQTLSEVLAWLPRIADTVDALHRRKYLHRDIKPDNILFDNDDKPFLADFGVVGLLDSEYGLESTIGGSAARMSPGSPGYQAPESLKVDEAARNAPASDQFSLGIAVYEALSGRLPMSAGSAAEWYGQLAHWAPTPLGELCPEIPSRAADAVMKAISAQARDRFLSCSEFAKAIWLAVHSPAPPPVLPPEPPVAPTPTPPDTKRGSASAWPRRLAIGLVLLLLALGLVVGVNTIRHRFMPAPSETTLAPLPARPDSTAGTTADSAAGKPAGKLAPASTVVTQKAAPAAVATVAEPDSDSSKIFLDSLKDVADAATVPPEAPKKEANQQERVAAACKGVDKDRDGVEDCLDFCPKEDPGYSPGKPVSPFGCKDSDWNVFWYSDPQKTTINADEMEGALVKIRKAPRMRIGVYGSDSTMGKRRVGIVIDYLVSHGVDSQRILEPKFQHAAPLKPGFTQTCGEDCPFDQVVSIAVEGAPGLLGMRR